MRPKKKHFIALLCVLGVFLLDHWLCRRIYYIPEAKVYVKQDVHRKDAVIKNYYSLRLLPILLERYESLDYIEMISPHRGFSREIVLQYDSLFLYMLDNDPSVFLDYQEAAFHIERYVNLVSVTTIDDTGKTVTHDVWPICPDRFYVDRELRPGYIDIYNTPDWGGYFFSASSSVKRAHLWFLVLPPRKA